MIRNDVEGLVLECDSCSNFIKDDTVHTYKEMSDLGKASGWIYRKINGQWYNFCCDECFIRKKEELGVDVVSEKFEKVEDKTDSVKLPKEIFSDELSYIRNDEFRVLAEQLLNALPSYFYEVAASSTGKYHPAYTTGKGGLVRHTQAAVRIAEELFRLECYNDLEVAHDHIIIALLLHDGFKHGMPDENGEASRYTESTHPKICHDWLKSLNHAELQEHLNYIADLVLTHMGQWNLEYRSGIVFAPKPQTMAQHFVHLCDYLASRKCLEFDRTIELA